MPGDSSEGTLLLPVVGVPCYLLLGTLLLPWDSSGGTLLLPGDSSESTFLLPGDSNEGTLLLPGDSSEDTLLLPGEGRGKGGVRREGNGQVTLNTSLPRSPVYSWLLWCLQDHIP